MVHRGCIMVPRGCMIVHRAYIIVHRSRIIAHRVCIMVHRGCQLSNTAPAQQKRPRGSHVPRLHTKIDSAVGWGLAAGRRRWASRELRRRGCILIWSNDRGGAPALKHCAGAHKMDGLVVTHKLQALKHCAGAAKIAGLEDGWLVLRI